MKIFLSIIFFFNFSFGTSQSLNPENLPNSLDPYERANGVYEREKHNIFTYIRWKFHLYKDVNIVFGHYNELVGSLKILHNLKTEELLKAMLNDDSDDLLVFFLFSCTDLKHNLIFTNTTELYSSRTKSFMRTRVLEKLYDNFRIFSSYYILNSKPSNWANPLDFSNGLIILKHFRDIWYTRVKPLGERILKSENLKGKIKLIEDKLIFWDIFLSHRTEDLLIREYPRLLLNIRGGINQITPAIRKFSILAQHFRQQLKEIEWYEHLSKFSWLASQCPHFLVYYFYFIDYMYWGPYRERPIPEDSIKSTANLYLSLRPDMIVIFGKKVDKFFENYDELRRLIEMIISKAKKPFGSLIQ